jgi:hypothetical protein
LRIKSVKAAQVAGAAIRVTVTAEDALIAALKVRSERPDAVIKYVRRRNKRGALRRIRLRPCCKCRRHSSLRTRRPSSDLVARTPGGAAAPMSAFATDFLSTRDGVSLVSAFRRIGSKDVPRAIVAMIEELTEKAR